MLATARTPYIGLPDFQSPPRIISEIKKPTPAWPRDNARPRITGKKNNFINHSIFVFIFKDVHFLPTGHFAFFYSK